MPRESAAYEKTGEAVHCLSSRLRRRALTSEDCLFIAAEMTGKYTEVVQFINALPNPTWAKSFAANCATRSVLEIGSVS